jgi:hypothetical protein
MHLNSKKVKVNGIEFEVVEIRVGKILPILPRLNGDEAEEAQLELMRECIYHGGEPIGHGVSELGISTYLELAKHVMEVNGLSEGKD